MTEEHAIQPHLCRVVYRLEAKELPLSPPRLRLGLGLGLVIGLGLALGLRLG